MLVETLRSTRGKPSIGIMQGRLTPSLGRGIQFFPFGEWESEFQKAADLGLNEIDFVFDLERYKENPLWSQKGISQIKSLVSVTGVKVKSICADFFLRMPPHDFPWTRSSRYSRNILSSLIDLARETNSTVVEIPLLENSSLNTISKITNVITFLNFCLKESFEGGVVIALETDLPSKNLLSLLYAFSYSKGGVRIVYDTGNSANLGYDPVKEIELLGEHIVNVHIKDRILGGGTVPLGTGAVDFDAVFGMLAEKNYRGSFILQAARGEDGKEIETVKEQLKFLNCYLEKYSFI